MYTVYLLRSKIASKSYVGVTDNIGRRLKEHNSGRHTYPKRYIPWEIIYKENFDNFTEASNREKYLKTASGRRFLKKIFEKLN